MHETNQLFENRKIFFGYIATTRPTISKDDLLCSLCEGKDVLDIGCIDHSHEVALAMGEKWLHRRLQKVSKSIVGTDILDSEIYELRKLGFSIVNANAESFDLRRTFDVIVAGDLIEHLSNVGDFLSCVAKHMHDDSICIITTPNPFNIEQSILALFENRVAVNPEHTAWIDPRTMFETVRRTSMRISDFHWIDTRFQIHMRPGIFQMPVHWIAQIIMRFRPVCRRDYAVILKKRML